MRRAAACAAALGLLALAGCDGSDGGDDMPPPDSKVDYNAFVIAMVETPSDHEDAKDINDLDFSFDDSEGVFDALFDD